MHYDMTDAGIHIEITSGCNSRCLDCGRFVRGTDILNLLLILVKTAKWMLKQLIIFLIKKLRQKQSM